MTKLNLEEHPHRRYNILTGEWILVSPHRAKRPWQGKVEDVPVENKPEFDPGCYLCPGNKRAGDVKNPEYSETFVFDNDFSALKPDTSKEELNEDSLLMAKGEPGICRVVCFSPKHNLTLSELSVSEIRNIVDVWTKEYEDLGKRDYINYVQIFENKGEIMGCSNPHPHGQIWAENSIPVEPSKETAQMSNYLQKNNSCLLCDYLKIEVEKKQRIVTENEDFVVLVPFWAVWPFETIIISRRHLKNLSELNKSEKDSFADIIKKITAKYDKLFNVSFPYSAGIHQSPTDSDEHNEWHFHYHFYPPLLRSADVKKFMVGYEMLGNPQRDITAESSAERLRNL